MKPWPEDAPEYHNANVDACDAWEGPCACGAWHEKGEFELVGSTLYRYGEYVAGEAPKTFTETSKDLPQIL